MTALEILLASRIRSTSATRIDTGTLNNSF